MNTRRLISTYAPPGKGQAIQDDPAAHARSNGEGGGPPIQPLKDRNPAPSVLGPSWTLPLALLSWILVGFPAALVLRALGGGHG